MLALMAGESPDRRQRYDERMREAGHVKRTYWLPADLADDLRDALRCLSDRNGSPHSVIIEGIIRSAAAVARGECDPK